MAKWLVSIEEVQESSGCGKLIVQLVILFFVWMFLAKVAECGPYEKRHSDATRVNDPVSTVSLNEPPATQRHQKGALAISRPRAAGGGGNDPAQPSLSPSDEGYIDTRAGWGWGDRCWNNIKAGQLGWAKAECRMGMSLADPTAQQPRASLLYNMGLIEKAAGNLDDARRFFQQSLALREHPEVRAALDSLP